MIIGGIGTTHNEIAAICLSVLAERLGIKKDEIPMVPWHRIIYAFAASTVSPGLYLDEQQIRRETG